MRRLELVRMDYRMSPLLRAASLLPLVMLTACAGSQRFGGPGYGPAPVARAPVYNEPMQPAPPIQSAPITSEPLPPPGGYPSASAQAGGYPPPGQPGVGAGGLPPPSDPFFDPQAARPGQQPGQPSAEPAPQQRNQVANVNPGAGGGGAPAPTRNSVVGSWTAQEATGSSCRVQLSSSPTLDLYRASANGCSNRDLQQVNAWDYRNGEVYLYQRGGSVVARLRVGSGGAMNGAITKSGAALSLNR